MVYSWDSQPTDSMRLEMIQYIRHCSRLNILGGGPSKTTKQTTVFPMGFGWRLRLGPEVIKVPYSVVADLQLI